MMMIMIVIMIMRYFQNFELVGIRSDRLTGLTARARLEIIWPREAKIQSCDMFSLPGARREKRRM